MSETVLIVAAHPDDEVLGCGGTAALRARRGDRVHIATLASGVTSRRAVATGAPPSLAAVGDHAQPRHGDAHANDALKALHEDAHAVAAMLGAESISIGDGPDNELDTVPLLELVKEVEALIERWRPAVVYTHHPGDLNVDHRIAFQAVLTATRPAPECVVREVYAFEVASSTEWALQQLEPPFRPNVFEDIAATIDLKIQCLERYRGEVRAFPHPRSAEGLRVAARRWGATVGMAYAEPFQLIRSVRRAALDPSRPAHPLPAD